MLNPETNPLYRQVLYDGEKKTNIKTIQEHKNQRDQLAINWEKTIETARNADKITSLSLPKIGITHIIKPIDNAIFTFDDPSKSPKKVPQKYQMRYQSKSSLFSYQSKTPRAAESSSKQIGRFVTRNSEGGFILPPIEAPSESYRNRSRIFFG